MAGRAILTAIEEDFVLPVETLRAAWDWLLHEPGFFHGAESFALLDDEHVRVSALAALEGAAVDRHSLVLVEMALAGSGHAHHIDDETVRRLVEQSVTGSRADAVAGVVAGVHAARGLPAALLREARDRWALGNAAVREAAVAIAWLEDDVDPAFVASLLQDPASQVRQAVADELRRNPLFDRDGASAQQNAELILVAIRERVRVEPCREVREVLASAITSMEATATSHGHVGPRFAEPNQHDPDSSDLPPATVQPTSNLPDELIEGVRRWETEDNLCTFDDRKRETTSTLALDGLGVRDATTLWTLTWTSMLEQWTWRAFEIADAEDGPVFLVIETSNQVGDGPDGDYTNFRAARWWEVFQEVVGDDARLLVGPDASPELFAERLLGGVALTHAIREPTEVRRPSVLRRFDVQRVSRPLVDVAVRMATSTGLLTPDGGMTVSCHVERDDNEYMDIGEAWIQFAFPARLRERSGFVNVEINMSGNTDGGDYQALQTLTSDSLRGQAPAALDARVFFAASPSAEAVIATPTADDDFAWNTATPFRWNPRLGLPLAAAVPPLDPALVDDDDRATGPEETSAGAAPSGL